MKALLAALAALMVVGCVSTKTQNTGYVDPHYQNTNLKGQSVALQAIDKTQMNVQLIEPFKKDFKISRYTDADAVMAERFTEVLQNYVQHYSPAFKPTVVNDTSYDNRVIKKPVGLANGKSKTVEFEIPSPQQLASFAGTADVVLLINNVKFGDSTKFRTNFSAPMPGSKGGMAVNTAQQVLTVKLDYLYYHIKEKNPVSFGRIVQQIPAKATTEQNDWYLLMERSARQILQQSPFDYKQPLALLRAHNYD
jgi:hypothetical protein